MIESERDLFIRKLRELYHIQRELEDLQTELAEAATDEDLESFYMGHSEATTDQLARLDAIFEGVDAEPGPIQSKPLDVLHSERDDLVGDLRDPVLGDLVETEFGRAIERLELTKLDTLLEAADRLNLPHEIIDPLETTKAETEDALGRLQDLTQSV